MTKYAPFDAADYLSDDATIAEYLTAALEDPNPNVFLTAVRDVARARGMAQLAKDTGLGRESLYKALTPGAKPRYDTVLRLLNALGVQLTATQIPMKISESKRTRRILPPLAKPRPNTNSSGRQSRR